MNKAKIETLLELIDEVVNSNEGSWSDRRDAVLAEASEDDKTNLQEFVTWFSSEEQETN